MWRSPCLIIGIRPGSIPIHSCSARIENLYTPMCKVPEISTCLPARGWYDPITWDASIFEEVGLSKIWETTPVDLYVFDSRI